MMYNITTFWQEFESADQLKHINEKSYRRDWELKIRNVNIDDEI